jgi:hypothetical protein
MEALTIITDRFFLRTGIYSGNAADFETNPVQAQTDFNTEIATIDKLNVDNQAKIALDADFVTSGDTIASYDQSNDFNVGNTPIPAP